MRLCLPNIYFGEIHYITLQKSARGSKIKIAKKVRNVGKDELPHQLQCYAITKRKELERRDCTQIKDL